MIASEKVPGPLSSYTIYIFGCKKVCGCTKRFTIIEQEYGDKGTFFAFVNVALKMQDTMKRGKQKIYYCWGHTNCVRSLLMVFKGTNKTVYRLSQRSDTHIPLRTSVLDKHRTSAVKKGFDDVLRMKDCMAYDRTAVCTLHSIAAGTCFGDSL